MPSTHHIRDVRRGPGGPGVSSPCRGGTPRTVADAMVRCAYTHAAATPVSELRTFFADDHVHCAVIVEAGLLHAVVVREDILGADGGEPARRYGRVCGRTVRPDVELETVRQDMVERGVRRLAVVDDSGGYLGLLCLKRSERGFCAEEDVRARAVERASRGE